MECVNVKSEKNNDCPLKTGGAVQLVNTNNIATVFDGAVKSMVGIAMSNGVDCNADSHEKNDAEDSLESKATSDSCNSMQLEQENCASVAKSVIKTLVDTLIKTASFQSLNNGIMAVEDTVDKSSENKASNKAIKVKSSVVLKENSALVIDQHLSPQSNKQNDASSISTSPQTEDEKLTNTDVEIPITTSSESLNMEKGQTLVIPENKGKDEIAVVSSVEVKPDHTPEPHRVSKRKRIPKKIVDEVKKEVVAPIVKEKLPAVETTILYILGDLVWSFVPGHPIWPCMVVNDPMEPIFTKMQGGGMKPGRAYHVQFLGDSPEHGWIRETRVFPFTGRDDYERIVKEVAIKYKKTARVPKCEIPARLKDDWDSGMDEILEAVPCSVEDRIKKFSYDFTPHMKKMLKKKILNEERKSLLEKLMSAESSDDDGEVSEECPHSVSTSLSLPDLTNSCLETGFSSVLPADSQSKTQPIKATMCNPPAFEDRQSFLELCSELINSAISTSTENRVTTDLKANAKLVSAKLNTSEKSLVSPCSSRNVVPIFVSKKSVDTNKDLDGIDFSAFCGTHSQPFVTGVGSASAFDRCFPSSKDSSTSEISINSELDRNSFAPSNELASEDDIEKIEIFKYGLKLIKTSQKNVITEEMAENVAALVKGGGVKDNSYKHCTCTALQQSRGLKGGINYKLITLLDATHALDNGFSASAVSTSFNVPRSTLHDLKKRSVFSVKHHVQCKMFPDGVTVITDSLVEHVKSADDCRRLRLATPPESDVKPAVESPKSNPVVVLKRHSPLIQNSSDIPVNAQKNLEAESTDVHERRVESQNCKSNVHQSSKPVSPTRYTFHQLVCAVDEVVFRPDSNKNYAAVGRKHGVPATTLRKCAVRSKCVYDGYIKSNMTKEKRISILKKHRGTLRVRGAKLNAADQHDVSERKMAEFPSSSQSSSLGSDVTLNTKLRISSRRAPKYVASKTIGSIFAPARRHSYSMQSVKLAVTEAAKGGKVYAVARKYGIPDSTLRGKLARYLISQQKKQHSLKSKLNVRRGCSKGDLEKKDLLKNRLKQEPDCSKGILKKEDLPKKKLKEGSGYSEEDLTNAVNKAVKDGCLKNAANNYGIPVSSLRDVVLRRKNIILYYRRKLRLVQKRGFGRNNKFTHRVKECAKAVEETKANENIQPTGLKRHISTHVMKKDSNCGSEEEVEEATSQLFADKEPFFLRTLSTQLSWSWRMNHNQIKSCISHYLNESARDAHENIFVPDLWLKSFLRKNDIKPSLSDSTVDENPNPFKVFSFFVTLKHHIESLQGDPNSIFMVHEFLLPALNDAHSVRILAAVNAAGRKYPPLLIFKGTSLWCSSPNSCPGSQFAVSSSGKMTGHIWREWFCTFCAAVEPQPLLLLYDGEASSIPLDFVEVLESNIPMLKLPYSSNSLFQLPYAQAVKKARDHYNENYADKIHSHSDVIESVSELWRNSFTAKEIVHAFKASGFLPFNREKFPFETLCHQGHNKCLSVKSSNRTAGLQQRRSLRRVEASLPQNSVPKGAQHGIVLSTPSNTEVELDRPVPPKEDVSSTSPKQSAMQKPKHQWKAKLKKSSNSQVQNGRANKMRKKDMLAALMEPEETPNKELFKFYCEKRRGPLKAEHPNLTHEQEEALMWMEWETLSPKKQQKFGKKRGTEPVSAVKRKQRSETPPAKQKRGKRRKFIFIENEDAEDSQSASEPNTPGGSGFACSVCNISYPSKHSLSQHKRWCNDVSAGAKKLLPRKDVLPPTDVEDSPSLERAFTCERCGEKFYGEQSLQIHRKFCSATLKRNLAQTVTALKKAKKDRPKNGRLVKGSPQLPPMTLHQTAGGGASKDSPSRQKRSIILDCDATCESSNIIGHQLPEGSPNIRKPIRPRGRPQLGSTAKKENICMKCELSGPGLVSCIGGCFQSVHLRCLDLKETPKEEQYKCENCVNHTHPCFICKEGPESSNKDLGEIKRCNVQNCGKSYHTTCLHVRKLAIVAAAEDSGHDTLDSFRYALLNNSRCTLHHCATCASKVSSEVASSTSAGSRMFKCIRCPTAYHVGDDCIAAGSLILSGFNIMCPEHFIPMKNTPYHQPVHVSWCFICSKGGQLLCCESCPAAFHPKCVDMDAPPEGEWYCRDCRYRRRPLYGDIVWVKLGSYRWWPGEITHPSDIPENIRHLRHGVGEFVVNFFGSNDYFWLNKRRVFAYQEGDTGATTAQCSRGISSVFHRALRDASKKFDELTNQRQKIQDVKIQKKRPQYKYIKVNRPVGNVQVYAADMSEIPRCICKRTDQNPCGPESECLNRMLMFECHPSFCPAGDKCENQRFQKRDYPPSEVFKTPWGGWGLKSKVAIKKGEFVNEYVGELVDSEECLRRIEYAHKNSITNFYMLTIDKDRIIDAGPKGNFSRFMNHSCDPCCETQKWTVNGDTRVGLFARREIAEGEELTFNYNLDCLGNDKTPCMCGAKNCSGFIGVRPKPSIENGNGKSVDGKVKKKRRRNDHREMPKHDDFCFRCRQVGTLVCCDVRGCQRAFCLSCLRLTKPPFGKWECPWHHCDFCGRRAQSFCHFCPNSFCASHVSNQLLPSSPNQYDCCTDHDPNVAEYEMEEAIAAVVASMNPQENWDENLEAKEPEPEEAPTEEAKEEVKPARKRKPQKKDSRRRRDRTKAEKQNRRKKSNIVKVKKDIVVEMKEETVSPPVALNETIDETESDEALGKPTSSPVRRKRNKRRYFTGKKKRRRSKALCSLNSSFTEGSVADEEIKLPSTDDSKPQTCSDGEGGNVA